MQNWIQRHILTELTRHETRRYSELRPRDVEGNLFTYHLNGLLKDGLVEKAEGKYKLSTKGLQIASTLSLKTGRIRKQPKVVTAVIAKNDKGDYLFSRWHRQPNVGLVSFPYGMVHFGESILDMAALELAEKAGLTADLSYLGDIYIRSMRGNEVDRHMLVHLFRAHNLQAGRQEEVRPEASEPFWAPLNSVPRSEFVPGFYEITRLIEENSRWPIFNDLVVSE